MEDNDDNYDNAANDNYDDNNDDNDDDDAAEEDSEGELEGRPLLLPLRPCCPVNRRHRVITPSQLQLHLVHTVPRKHSITVTLHHGITTMYSCVPSWYYHGYIRSLHPKLAQFLPISSWDLSLQRKLAFGSFGKDVFISAT